jgi:hypothetical protein
MQTKIPAKQAGPELSKQVGIPAAGTWVEEPGQKNLGKGY